MAVLVTGATGFVGSFFVRKLVEEGEQVVGFDVSTNPAMLRGISEKITLQKGDVMDLPSVLRVVKQKSVDTIVHIGAFTKVDSDENPYQSFRINGEGTMNLLEASRISGVKRFVLMSAVDVYGEKPPSENRLQPVTEEAQVDPTGMIGIMKYCAERCGLYYSTTYGLDFVAMRFTAIFGPGKSLASRHTELTVENTIENAIQGKSSSVNTSSKDLLYVRDAANFLYKASKVRPLKSHVYNAGAGKLTSPKEIADAIQSVFPGVKVDYVDNGKRTMLAANDRAKSELGYSPQFDLIKAFKDYRDCKMSLA
ncbi:MAG: NAD(P)-dependent oxidoreductase [Nitrososphaerota archaeon]|nr:NAD(P)-dependent oxidoreductase [Nitrososphaerota archaeon]